MNDRPTIEAAFHRLRAELGIRAEFPPEALREAERPSAWERDPERADLTGLPFVTIDPPGSRDLDQALHIERAGDGYRVRYAIADVACFVERGGALEAEAWLRGVTYYSPDRRDPLYPPAVSQDAGSLLPAVDRPALVFDLGVDGAGALRTTGVARARVRSRAQLTYHEAAEQIGGDGARFAGEPFAESLRLLREVGERRIAVERARGGVSLPIVDQHVQRSTARRLGYEVIYETPSEAEGWNAQISLLAGHAAALRMREAGVGLLRTMPPPRREDLDRFRVAARALGFHWPDEVGYADFVHALEPTHPNLEVLVWQARRVTRGAAYRAFDGGAPPDADHAALAMPYAHCTAPLRRLADRYVLDLLVRLERGEAPTAAEIATLHRLPPVMEEAGRRAGRLERGAVDLAEAWELRDCVGERFTALVLDATPERLEAQLEARPVRARVEHPGLATPPRPGERVRLRLDAVDVEAGRAVFGVDPDR